MTITISRPWWPVSGIILKCPTEVVCVWSPGTQNIWFRKFALGRHLFTQLIWLQIFFSEQEEILGESSHVQVDVFNHFWFVGWSKYQVLRVTNWTNFHWMNKNCLEILAQSPWQFFQPLWTCQQHCYRLSVYEESQSYSNDMIHTVPHVDFEEH